MAYPSVNASIALIRHPIELESKWLAIWNDSAGHYDFVTAEKSAGISYRESLGARLPLELGLSRKRDYVISGMSRLHLDTALQLPERSSPTLFSVEFFVVDLYGKYAFAKIEDHPATAWLTVTELMSGQTERSVPISLLLVQLLQGADLFSAQSP